MPSIVGRWLWAIGLAVSIVGLAAGCGPKKGAVAPASSATGAKPGERIKIGFIVKMPDEKWFQNEWEFADRAGKKYGFEVVKLAGTDGEKVLSAIDTLAAMGAQGFVICTPDTKLGPAIVAKATAKNLKVYSVDDQFLAPDGKPMTDVPYMGISARSIGEQVGKALYEQYRARGWKPDDTAAAAITFEELNTSKERTDGALAALTAAGFPRERVYKVGERTTDVEGSFNAMATLLTQHPDVKHWLVFSMNDEGVLGAVRSLENRGFGADRVVGIGIGGSTAFAELEKPTPTGFVGTALISPLRHGFETTERLYKWITTGEKPPMDIRTSGTIVTRENYKKVAKEQGLL
jgi:L-arabinose transport system substrate-binding protein